MMMNREAYQLDLFSPPPYQIAVRDVDSAVIIAELQSGLPDLQRQIAAIEKARNPPHEIFNLYITV